METKLQNFDVIFSETKTLIYMATLQMHFICGMLATQLNYFLIKNFWLLCLQLDTKI